MVLKVLIVEDNPVILDLMAESFANAGVQVRGLEDSEDAVGIVQAEKFHGIFMDLEMPNGFQLIQCIRESSWNRSTPIIVVTGCSDHKAMERAFDFGATFFLQKPVDTQRLVRLFRSVQGTLLDNRRRFIRVSFNTNVLCHVRNAQTTGTTLNLSHGGMLLEDGSVPLGEEMTVSFRSPTTNAMVSATGRVVRVDQGQRIAIQFRLLQEPTRNQIRELIEQLAVGD
ncbi:MAG TPA: response regulator [Candidatus Angelobacter sp.]